SDVEIAVEERETVARFVDGPQCWRQWLSDRFFGRRNLMVGSWSLPPVKLCGGAPGSEKAVHLRLPGLRVQARRQSHPHPPHRSHQPLAKSVRPRRGRRNEAGRGRSRTPFARIEAGGPSSEVGILRVGQNSVNE